MEILTTTTTNGQISKLQEKLQTDLLKIMKTKELSQAQMAGHCGVSSGSMSDLLGQKKAFSDSFLGRLSSKLRDFASDGEQLFTSVRQYQRLTRIAAATRKDALFALASGNTGIGKTTTMRQLFASEKHTFYLKIEDNITWRELLTKIAIALGVKQPPYKTEPLRQLLQQRIELLSMHEPLLIIDEAEELTRGVAHNLKRLETLTERQLGVLIVAHSSMKKAIAQASNVDPATGQPLPGRTEPKYATLWRRLTFFDIQPVSDEDIEKICKEELGIESRQLIAAAQERWTNYGYMAKDLSLAAATGLHWSEMTLDEFNFLSKH